jgi:hypothetical protein
MEENNDIEGSIQIDTQADITPEYNPETTPQHKNIDIEILSSQVSQRTLVYQRALEKQPVILIMEIFAKGDNSYLHMPMRDLFFRIRHISDTIEVRNNATLYTYRIFIILYVIFSSQILAQFYKIITSHVTSTSFLLFI